MKKSLFQILFFFLTSITLLQSQIDIEEYVKVENSSYSIADFSKLLSGSDISQLKEKGVSVLEYVDGTRYLVCSKNDFRQLNAESALALNVLSRKEKLSENLYVREYCSGSKNQDITIQYLPLVDIETIKKRCLILGINLRSIYESYRLIYITCDKDQFETLSNENWLQYATCTPDKGTPDDREGRSLHRVNLLGESSKSGINLDGQGVNVLVRDDGVVGPHIDFQERLINQTFGSDGSHGDGVAGIIGGAGNVDPLMEGMAPRCKVYAVNYQDDFLDNTLNLHQSNDVVITNSSYSNGCNAGYTYITQIVDKQMYDNPSLLHCFSAGNSNNANCNYGAGNQWGNVTGGHKIGKNVITAANLTIAGVVDNTSSRGPTRDRRLKPDISARGTNQNSTAPSNAYLVFGGTSAASPGVAGTAALLYQAYKKENNGVNPTSALIKAILMNTATDLGPQGPDFVYGFGVLDGYRAAKLLQEKRYKELTVKNGENIEIEIDVPANSAVAKFMFYWPEKEASLNARKVLINDIDLEVITPTGTIVLPWVPNPTPDSSILAAGPRPGVDTLNNVEQVAIQFPEAGKYKIIIKGKFLPNINVPGYLLYDFPENKLEITSPVGGEKYNTLEATNIYYRSYQSDSIKIELSTDSGSTWRSIRTVLGTTRLTPWNTPSNVNSKTCIIRLTQGSNTIQSELFTITNPVTGLKVDKFCPDEVTLTWVKSSKESFIVYSLQGQEMKEIARTNNNSVTIPITSRSTPLWFSVAGDSSGVLGRRTKAIGVPDTLVKCVVANDISIKPKNDWLTERRFISCDTLDKAYPEVWVTNRNVNEVKDFEVHYLFENKIVTEKITKTLKYRDSILVILSKGIPLHFIGSVTIPIWTVLKTDEHVYNDSTNIVIMNSLVPDTKGVFPMIEDFEKGQIPANWIVQNDLPYNSWKFSDQIDINGGTSKVVTFSNNNYSFSNQLLNLITTTVDLTSSVEPYFYMDYAYHKSTTFLNLFDTMSIEILDLCSGAATTKLLYTGADQDLYTTTPTMNENWIPTDSRMWRNISINLSLFKGKKIVVRINLIRGVFSNLYIDNVKVIEKLLSTPVLNMSWTPMDVCANTIVRFTGSVNPSGSTIRWNFGNSGSPRLGSGNGPVPVRFSSAGKKTIIMSIQDSNQIVINSKEFIAYLLPQVSFDFDIIGSKEVKFNNYSTQVRDILWEFGDGTTSNELNPKHEFPELKLYNVTLTITNACGTNKISRIVDLSPIAVKDVDRISGISVLPNPSTGIFYLTSKDEIQELKVCSSNGKILSLSKPYVKELRLDLSEFHTGLYLLKIKTARGEYANKIIIEE
ncbi:MAG: S8 family serine peptidase [Saprospiraceae bacterium]|nr:S8 family serine peptidase [Saprospiraceae bacterium]